MTFQEEDFILDGLGNVLSTMGLFHVAYKVFNGSARAVLPVGSLPMKLIFLLQKNAWFIEHDTAWYCLKSSDEIALAQGGLALEMVNVHELIEQPHQAGYARVSQLKRCGLSMELRRPDESLVEAIEIQMTPSVLLDVKWKTRKFRDGWMSSESAVTLSNVGTLLLDAYLPASEESEGKMLTISNPDTGKTREVWMARDRKTRVAVYKNGHKGRVNLNLSCEPEKTDQSSDPRQLGFIMIAEEARPV